jgi:hypothetical protein
MHPMKKSIVVLAVMFFGYASYAQNTVTLLNNYFSVKDALVQGDYQAAAEAIHIFYQAVKNDKDLAGKTDLVKATEKIDKAKDLKSERNAFNDVSVAMWNIVKKSGQLQHPVYYQYCPMKKGYWLSHEKEIKNPYYGSSMLNCGEVVATKQ